MSQRCEGNAGLKKVALKSLKLPPRNMFANQYAVAGGDLQKARFGSNAEYEECAAGGFVSCLSADASCILLQKDLRSMRRRLCKLQNSAVLVVGAVSRT